MGGGREGAGVTSTSPKFDLFYICSTLLLPTKFQVKWPFGSGEGAKNSFIRMAAMAVILDFRSEQQF